MQVSSGRLTGIKVVLVVFMVLLAFWGIYALVFPKVMWEARAPEGEPFTSMGNVVTMFAGAFSLAWVVALAIALGNPLGNRGLIQAIIAGMGIFGLITVYVATAVAEQTTAIGLGTSILLLALSVALWVLYPWGRKA